MSDTIPEPAPDPDPIDAVAEGQVRVARELAEENGVTDHPAVESFERALKGATTRSGVLSLTRPLILAIQAGTIARAKTEAPA